MAKLLVTGGAGFIGTNFVRYWRDHHANDQIVVLDALTYAGNRANLDTVPDIDFVQGDIRDTALVETLLGDRRLDTIVHFAAETHVDRSITGPDAFIETNVIGTHSLLKAARKIWMETGAVLPHRFHHVSTDEVYGSLDPEDPPFTEENNYRPNSPYSASKAASDHLVRAYHHTYGLRTTISNCSNNFGPYQYPEKLIPLFILNALHGTPLPIYGDGLNVRDWLHVEDHCRGIALILQSGDVGEVYNIGGGMELANVDLIDAICGQVDRAFATDPSLATRFPNCPAAQGLSALSLKTFVPDRPGHDRRYAIDETKIRERLGYVPSHDFKARLSDTLQWYIAAADRDNA